MEFGGYRDATVHHGWEGLGLGRCKLLFLVYMDGNENDLASNLAFFLFEDCRFKRAGCSWAGLGMESYEGLRLAMESWVCASCERDAVLV